MTTLAGIGLVACVTFVAGTALGVGWALGAPRGGLWDQLTLIVSGYAIGRLPYLIFGKGWP